MGLLAGQSCFLSASGSEDEHSLTYFMPQTLRATLRRNRLPRITDETEKLSRLEAPSPPRQAQDQKPDGPAQGPAVRPGRPRRGDELSRDPQRQRQPGRAPRLSCLVLLFPGQRPSGPGGRGACEVLSLAETSESRTLVTKPLGEQWSPLLWALSQEMSKSL